MKGRGLVLLAALLCASWSGPVSAQEVPPISGQVFGQGAASSEDAIFVGPFLFSPSIQLAWQDRDNIFFTPDNEVGDQVFLARANLRFEAPLNQSVIRFSYTPQYRDNKTYHLKDNWQHFFAAGGDFVFSSGLVLNATYNYIVGNLETRQVDPGGELVYGDPNFVKNFAGIGGNYWLTPRDGILFDASYTDVDYDDPGLFYDYTSVAAGLGWSHQMNSMLVMNLRYGVIDFDAHDSPLHSNDFRDSQSQEVTLGFQGRLSPVVETEIAVGYRVTEYNVQTGDPPVEDFAGVIARGFFNWEMGHGSLVRLDVLRMPYPSNYAFNAKYVATGGGLLYSLDRGKVSGQASGRFQNNDYDLPDPVTGELRSDDILTLGLGLGFRVNTKFSLWGSYLYEDRESLYRYSYTTNIFTLGLVLGF